MTASSCGVGTATAYKAGCRCDACTHAQMVDQKLHRMGRKPSLIDRTGTVRRLQALLALGHAGTALGTRLGRSTQYVDAVLHDEHRRIRSDVAADIAALYDELCMVVPTDPWAARRRRLYASRGYVPPLAWDDIDNDPCPIPQYRRDDRRAKTDVDEVAVLRRLNGDHSVPITRAERLELVTRLHARGYSDGRISDATGIDERHIVRLRRVLGLPAVSEDVMDRRSA